MVLMGAFGMGAIAAHNVNGIWDSINDLAYGIGGAIVYTAVFLKIAFAGRRRAKPQRRQGFRSG